VCAPARAILGWSKFNPGGPTGEKAVRKKVAILVTDGFEQFNERMFEEFAEGRHARQRRAG